MVLEIQIAGIVFMVFMLYLTFLFYKRSNYGRRSFWVWVVVWTGGALSLLFPQFFSGIVRSLSLTRATDLYVAIGMMFFSLVTFFNYVNVKRQERVVEGLVRAVALEKPKKRK